MKILYVINKYRYASKEERKWSIVRLSIDKTYPPEYQTRIDLVNYDGDYAGWNMPIGLFMDEFTIYFKK